MIDNPEITTSRTTSATNPIETTGATAAIRRPGLVRSLVASGIGNILEWFDWGIYAVLSPFIAGALFNPKDSTSALLSTLAIFAVGFVARPLGGLVFGFVSNRIGRKNVLLITMSMTAIGSLIVALIPTYTAIGGWAAAILLIARLGQGFGHGGESATTYTYIGEIAPARRRGLWGSTVFMCLVLGSVLAYGVSAGLTAGIAPAGMASWGWRVPFLLGALLALYALYLRRGMVESVDVNVAGSASVDVKAKVQSGPSWSRGKIVVTTIKLVFLISGLTAVQYAWISSASTLAITQRGMAPSTAYLVMLVAQVLLVIALPFWGMLSDRIGRRPMFIISAVALAILQIPLGSVIGSSAASLLIPAAIILVIFAMAGSVSTAILTEAVPTRHRAVVIGVASSLAVALFGGTAPYLQALFVAQHMAWAFDVYVIVLLCATLIAAISLKENKGIELKDVS